MENVEKCGLDANTIWWIRSWLSYCPQNYCQSKEGFCGILHSAFHGLVSEATQCHPCCTLSLKKVPRAHHVSMGRDVDPHLLTQEWRGWGKSVRWRYFVANVRKYNVPHTLQNISFCSCNPLSYLNITSNLLVMLLPKSFLVPFPHQDRRLQCTHTNQNTSIVYMRVGHCSVWHSSQNDNTL